MYSLMYSELAATEKRFATLSTFVRFLSRMYSVMCIEMALIVEGFVTLITFVRLFIGV